MYLYALGIYEYDPEKGCIELKKIAQRETLDPKVPNQLQDLENKLFPKFPETVLSLVPHRIYFNDNVFEQQFVQKYPKDNLILAIVGRNILKRDEDLKETENLKETLVLLISIFHNMRHIYLKETKYRTTLDELLHNPLLKKDVIVDTINQTIDETKEVSLNNIELFIERGDNLDATHENTIRLTDHAKEYDNSAKKLKVCCKW